MENGSDLAHLNEVHQAPAFMVEPGRISLGNFIHNNVHNMTIEHFAATNSLRYTAHSFLFIKLLNFRITNRFVFEYFGPNTVISSFYFNNSLVAITTINFVFSSLLRSHIIFNYHYPDKRNFILLLISRFLNEYLYIQEVS